MADAADKPAVLRREVLAPDDGVVKEVTREGSGDLPQSGFEITGARRG